MDSKPPVKSYCGGKPNYCTPEETPEVTGEVTGGVDAVNMPPDRVDETAKGEHEPVAWFIQYEDSHEFVWSKPDGWRVKQALEIQPLYTAPPKREWVGLTDAQVEEIAEYHGIDGLYETSRIDFYRAIEITLKEKNGG